MKRREFVSGLLLGAAAVLLPSAAQAHHKPGHTRGKRPRSVQPVSRQVATRWHYATGT